MQTFPLYLPLGCLAAHTQAGVGGFRQREVKFFSELFSNWVNLGGVGAMHSLHNTQVARYLTGLVEDAQAKPLGRSHPPHYRLTRLGMFSLLSQVTLCSYLSAPKDCLLVWYFLRSYAAQLRRIIRGAGSEFSRAHALELEQLLDVKLFLTRQLQFVEQEIIRLTERIDTTHAMQRDFARLRIEGRSAAECIAHVAKFYPYELNAQRSFDELLLTIPPEVMEWELTEGASIKAEMVFRPILEELRRFNDHLRSLKGEPV
jgi:hypothetical protein